MHFGLDVIAKMPYGMVQSGGELDRHIGVTRGDDKARYLLGRRNGVRSHATAAQFRSRVSRGERRHGQFEMVIDSELVRLLQSCFAQLVDHIGNECVGDRQRRQPRLKAIDADGRVLSGAKCFDSS